MGIGSSEYENQQSRPAIRTKTKYGNSIPVSRLDFKIYGQPQIIANKSDPLYHTRPLLKSPASPTHPQHLHPAIPHPSSPSVAREQTPDRVPLSDGAAALPAQISTVPR